MNKVLILGNSVSLICRPPLNKRGYSTYCQLLEQHNTYMKIKMLSDQAAIITDGLTCFYSEICAYNPDSVIIAYGINEACTRFLPRKLNQVLFADKRDKLKTPVIKKILQKIIRFIEPHAIRLFRLNGWVKPAKYYKYLTKLITLIKKECNSKVILITIPNVTDRIEKQLPGSRQKILEYNKEILKIAQDELCDVVDCFDLFSKYDINDVTPDGIHLSEMAHKLIFEELKVKV